MSDIIVSEKKRKKISGWFWVSLALVLLIVLAIVAVATKQVSVSVNFLNGSQAVGSVACGNSLVEKYNQAFTYTERDGTIGLDSAAVDSVRNEVKSVDNSQNDATCQAMRFWLAIQAGDHSDASEAYNRVTELHQQGVFANSNLINNTPLSTYKPALFSIDPENLKQQGGEAPE